MLLHRGARVNATNMGDDIPLHLAAAHGHLDIVQLVKIVHRFQLWRFVAKFSILQLLKHKSDVNTTNEHGNSPLHYACFWGYQAIAEELVNHGALVSVANKDGDTPLDKTKQFLANRLHDLAIESGQELRKISFKDQSWLGLKTRSRDATLSRYKGINIRDLELHTKLAMAPSGDTWRGRWQKNDIVAKILSVRDCSARISRDFNEEFPKLRIFSHPNILPVIGACNAPPNLVVISQVKFAQNRGHAMSRQFIVPVLAYFSTCREVRCSIYCMERQALWWTPHKPCVSRWTLLAEWHFCIHSNASYPSTTWTVYTSW